MIVWQKPNLLLLDEPTNHLDLNTREALSVALNEFEGTVMLVSHDRALLRAVCDEFWLVGRGVVGPFDGDLDDYQRYLLDEAKRLRAEATATSAKPQTDAVPRASAQEQRQLQAQQRQQLAARLKPMKKELEQAERRMAALEAEKAQLEAKLGASRSHPDIAEDGRRLKAIAAEVERLEERWLALSEDIEAGSSGSPPPRG
jgi:ATP-binding cassette subfamily F protein 3